MARTSSLCLPIKCASLWLASRPRNSGPSDSRRCAHSPYHLDDRHAEEIDMKKGSYVRLIKLRSTPSGIVACPMPLYAPGAWDEVMSLPIHYWMEGYLLGDLVKRNQILVNRYVRNGVIARGFFTSSRICSVKADEVETYNSIYRVMKVPPLVVGDEEMSGR
jgi:hypothetical protein